MRGTREGAGLEVLIAVVHEDVKVLPPRQPSILHAGDVDSTGADHHAVALADHILVDHEEGSLPADRDADDEGVV